MRSILVIASALVAFSAAAQATQSPPPGAPASAAPRTYYYWLHPKLGMVKVDRATNAMVTSRQVRAQASQASPAPPAAN